MERGTSVNRLSVNMSPCAAPWIETLSFRRIIRVLFPESGVHGGGSDLTCFVFP